MPKEAMIEIRDVTPPGYEEKIEQLVINAKADGRLVPVAFWHIEVVHKSGCPLLSDYESPVPSELRAADPRELRDRLFVECHCDPEISLVKTYEAYPSLEARHSKGG